MANGMRIFTVDAFTDRPFAGNPAAVCVLDKTADESWMQSVAVEMNYSETAFVRKTDTGYQLRWFTPGREVKLCGHATLATAHILWTEFEETSDVIAFDSLSGRLTATRLADESRQPSSIELDFPATGPTPTELPPALLAALGVTSEPVYSGTSAFDAFVVLNSESQVRGLKPNLPQLSGCDFRGVIVTALPDDAACEYDFVSRFFAPGVGVDEDPVTGSAHCCLAPYWAAKLERDTLTGYQASWRGGLVGVTVQADRVLLRGQAVTTVRGELLV